MSTLEKYNNELEKLERSSRTLILENEELRTMSATVVEYVNNFSSNLHSYKAYEHDLGENEYRQANAENEYHLQFGTEHKLKEIIKVFDTSVARSGIQGASGGCLGYIPGGGVTLSAFGDLIAAMTNKFTGVHSACPGGADLENHVIEWAAHLFGFDKGNFGGNLCTGGSIGVLMCLAAAREKHKIKARDYEHSVVYMSEQTHFCADKALKIIGMQESVLRKITVDADYCVETSVLERTIEKDVENGLKPFVIIGSVGTTATGSIDDIEELARIATRFGCWLHVDGCYGGFFYMLDEIKGMYKGIEHADSLVVDPHKSLFMPYGSGLVLVREREYLARAFSYTSAYIIQDEEIGKSPADVSPEMSRNFRGVRIWLPLMYHGLQVFKDALREKLILIEYAYNKMKKFKFLQLGPRPQLTVFIFRFTGHGINGKRIQSDEDVNRFNEEMMGEFLKDGRVLLSSTVIDGVYWMRVVILSVRSHKSDVDAMLDMIHERFLDKCNQI